jgi:hypothetical protein
MRILLSLVVAISFLVPFGGGLAAQVAGSSKVWLGRSIEFEEFLKTADIQRLEELSVGITRPKRAFFRPGGLAASAIVKSIDAGVTAVYLDSFRAEIAAYELDKLLDLQMVPPTVCRRVEGDRRSVQLWVENCRAFKKLGTQQAPDSEKWNLQVHRMRMFDNLIGNLDRHGGNILIDPDWNIILIDHSRAFDGRNLRLIYAMTRIDREFYERVKALDATRLKAALGPWAAFGTDQVLARRDRIVRLFERLIAEHGEANVIVG